MSDSVSLRGAPEKSPAGQRSLIESRLTAIGLICAAIVLFAFLDTSAKYLTTVAHLPVFQVVWTRFASHTVLATVVLGPKAVLRAARTGKPGHQILRSTFLVGATAFNFLALQYLQLDHRDDLLSLTLHCGGACWTDAR
jgi:hypothetical protein